jgi:CRP/FNR family transcriptional regulator, cyclic AMP receptor protein
VTPAPNRGYTLGMAENPLYEKYGQSIGAGRVIFEEGEEGKHMYIIQDGTVRITRSIDGKEHVLADLGKGDFFGEMAIVSRIKRTATATTVTPVQLLTFDRQGFQSMIEKNSKIAMNVIDKLCRRVEQANTQIQRLFQKNEESLIAINLYYRFLEKPAEEQALALDRACKEIGMELEVPGEKVREKILGLAEKKVVSISGNALRLTSKEKLSAIAEKVT